MTRVSLEYEDLLTIEWALELLAERLGASDRVEMDARTGAELARMRIMAADSHTKIRRAISRAEKRVSRG